MTAQAINFEAGAGHADGTHRPWFTWHSNSTDPVEFDLPIDLLYARDIWLKGTSVPWGAESRFCVGYANNFNWQYSFGHDEDHQPDQDDHHECDCYACAVFPRAYIDIARLRWMCQDWPHYAYTSTAPEVPAFPIVTSTIGVHVEAVTPNLSIAESAIPILFEGALLDQEVPHWGPEDFYFKVWRPPLENVALKNDTLSLGLQSYFYLAVGDPYDPFIQCGFRHERALHRSIAMESKLGWGKNWQVQTTTTATLGDPDTKCVLSFIHYDATHLLDDNLGKALQAGAKGLDEAIGKQTNQLSNARLFWDNTKATRQLSPGVWLQLRPKNVNAGSVHSVPTTDANIYRLSSDFALTAEPQLTYGERPKDDTTALPDLSVFTPTSQNIDLYPELRLSTTNATKLLASKFPITINYGRHQLELTDPIVQISGGKLVVRLQIRSGVNRLKGRNKPIISPIRNVYMKMVYAILEKNGTTKDRLRL
jgi:hypothetical protein